MAKNILCVPLDPVHDVGIKIIRNALAQRGHRTELLSPDLDMDEVVRVAAAGKYDDILVSRTLGYGIAELLGRFVDLLDAAGVRKSARVILGGKAVTAELAAELGFDRGFDEHAPIEEVVAYIEGRSVAGGASVVQRERPDMTAGYSYIFQRQSGGGVPRGDRGEDPPMGRTEDHAGGVPCPDPQGADRRA